MSSQGSLIFKRIFGWILILGIFGSWLFSDMIWPGNKAIYDAIADDDGQLIRQLIAQGADPNSQSEPLTLTQSRTYLKRYQFPPLIYALRHGKATAAMALIEGGANPNAVDGDGRSALDMANSQHLDNVANALAQRGAVSRRRAPSPASHYRFEPIHHWQRPCCPRHCGHTMTLVIFHRNYGQGILASMSQPPNPRSESPTVIAAVVIGAILFAWAILWLMM